MCLFSKPVEQVCRTRIYMRELRGWQCVVYEMCVKFDGKLAMILPVPALDYQQEGAVTPIDLSGYPNFFDDMDNLFLKPRSTAGVAVASTLEVQKVGSFIFSYVPSVNDFSRLDHRFHLPKTVLQQFPQYQRDYGFAVFQLDTDSAELTSFHPMAYSFRSANRTRLVFPTTHYSRQGNDIVDYDHHLYIQLPKNILLVNNETGPKSGLVESLLSKNWEISTDFARSCLSCNKTSKLVDPDLPLARLQVQGKYPNGDYNVDLI